MLLLLVPVVGCAGSSMPATPTEPSCTDSPATTISVGDIESLDVCTGESTSP